MTLARTLPAAASIALFGSMLAGAADPAAAPSLARDLFLSAKIDSIGYSDDDRNGYDYVETRHLEQHNLAGAVFASSEEVRRVTYAGGLRRFDVLSESSRGRFDFGFPGSAGLKAPPYHFGLQAGPAIEPGSANDYVFEDLGTEELEGTVTRVCLATVRPERAARNSRQWIKLWIEPDTREARRFEMRSRNNSLFLDYDIRLRIEVSRGPDRKWFPVRKELDFRYKLAFHAWRQGMTTSAYAGAVPAPEGERARAHPPGPLERVTRRSD